MEHSASIASLAAALSNFQASVHSVPFDGNNAFLNSRYATLKAMIETARPGLAENGLSVSQIVVSYDGQIGVETVLMHSSGEWISNTAILPPGAEKGKSSAQVAGSTITYLRRYSYASILGLYADEDTDGNGPQQNAKQATPGRPRQAPQATAPTAQGETTHIPGAARLCDLEGPQLYAIQKGGPTKFNMHAKRFENTWKKEFNVRALKDVTVTLDEFVKRMNQHADPEKPATPTLDAYFDETQDGNSAVYEGMMS